VSLYGNKWKANMQLSNISFRIENKKLKGKPLTAAVKKSIPMFFLNLFGKSQLGLFDSTVGTMFEQPKIGDRKTEGGTTYIFLETTPGRPRWHTEKEAEQISERKEKSSKLNTELSHAINQRIETEKKKSKKEESEYLPFKEVVNQQKPPTGKYEIGEVYWWEHPNPKFKEYSKEVIVAGKEIDSKIPMYSFTKHGIETAGIPANTAIPELVQKMS
jgi:hypothetical protein